MGLRVKLLSAALTAFAVACADATTGPAARDLAARDLAARAPSLARAEKVTICHAAGRAGTTHYVEINVSGNAGYTPHLNDNGTAAAGHEQDYLAADGIPCGMGTLQLCVALIGTNAAAPGYTPVTFAVNSDPVSATFTDTGCNAPTAVPTGTYRVVEPAPGITDPDPADNGSWFIRRVDATIDAATTIITSTPANGIEWGPLGGPATGRGADGEAFVPVELNKASKVTYTNMR